MFGIKSKYTPSASNNKNLQKDIIKELSAVIYRLEKGKYNASLDPAAVNKCKDTIKNLSTELSKSYGTGRENLSQIAEDASQQIEKIIEASNQALTNRFVDAVNELGDTIEFWIDVNWGRVNADEFGSNAGGSKNRTIEKLAKKVEEYENMNRDLELRRNKISKDIEKYSADVAEYERQIKEEYVKPQKNAIKIKQIFKFF